MPNLDEQEAAALAALLGALRDPERVFATWRAKALFGTVGEDGVRLSRGLSGSPEVRTVAERYLAAVGRPLPSLLLAFLEAYDGYEIRSVDGEGITVVDGSGFDMVDGLLPARHLESDETGEELSGVLIGKAYYQCRVILVDEGEKAGAVVFDDGDGDVILAPSLATFFEELATHGLSIEALSSAKNNRFEDE